ncbi:MAG: S8 family serine peptidase [Candidatus Harrisonbacteria bacterium]|nr:S8 family serine peptidase [Candidatus Harrisonbacteria bacterium]
MNSQKIIFVIFCIIAIVIALFVINKIETAPQQVPVTTQLTAWEIPAPAPPTKALAPAGKETPLEKEYPRQVMIGLRAWSDVESAKKIITDNGGQIIKTLKWPAKNVIIAVLPDKNVEQKILKNSFWGKLIGGIGLTSLGNKLSGGVDYVEKDLKVPAQAINPIDWGVARIKADKVWNASTGKGVKVAVIDSGIQRDHPDLVANIKGGISFMPGSPAQWDDEGGHGTKVAGLIAAVNNDIGYVGVAPEADIYAVKVMGKDGLAATSDMISGIYWAADNGMDVVNLSLGVYMDPVIYSKTIAEEKAAVDYAYSRGVVLIASSGNEPKDGPDCDKVIYPAALDAVIAVGATAPDNTVVDFSCHGPEVELAAPGLFNNVPVMGSSYGYGNGTSIAAPFVSGVAALILQKNPQFTPSEVRERLDSTAVDFGAPGRDEYFGYGLVNAYDSLFPPVLPVTITLIYPKGGEKWWEGTQQKVSWSVANVPSGEKVDKVDIQLIRQSGGTIETIPLALDAVNNGSLLLNVPSGLLVTGASDSYYLQVSCAKSFVGKCQPAKSGPLDITAVPPQALKIISPNGGEQWPQGTIQSVLWTGNYFGGPNVDITLLKKTQISQYSLSFQSPESWYGGGIWDPRGIDTCNGNFGKRVDGGVFSCPATYSSDSFSCVDVATDKSVSGWYWKTNVTCAYKQTGLTDATTPVQTLAANIINKGSAEIAVPSDAEGNNYLIQLSCANFTGECAKGLSNAPFSIIRLADPVVLTINKFGAGAVTDGNIICGSSRDACLENYERGTAVTLSAASTNPIVIFTGWSGACSGTGTCQVTMGGDQSVTATFSVRAVTLIAEADPGSIFTGWSGACSGTGTCQVTSDQQSVTANFIKSQVIQTPPPPSPSSPSPSPSPPPAAPSPFTPVQLREVKP